MENKMESQEQNRIVTAQPILLGESEPTTETDRHSRRVVLYRRFPFASRQTILATMNCDVGHPAP